MSDHYKTIITLIIRKIEVDTSDDAFKEHGFYGFKSGDIVLSPYGEESVLEGFALEDSSRKVLWYTPMNYRGKSCCHPEAKPEDFTLLKSIIVSDEKEIYVDPSEKAFKELGFEEFHSGQKVRTHTGQEVTIEGVAYVLRGHNYYKVMWLSYDGKQAHYYHDATPEDFTPIKIIHSKEIKNIIVDISQKRCSEFGFLPGQKVKTSTLFSEPKTFIVEGVGIEPQLYYDKHTDTDFPERVLQSVLWLSPLEEKDQGAIYIGAGSKNHFTLVP